MKTVDIVVTLSVVGLGYLVLCRYWKLDKDYEKLPKLFTLDDYDECMENPEGLYCFVDIELTMEESSELWYRIKNISANSVKYFQHDIVHRGICVTKNSDFLVSVDALHSDKHVLQAVLEELGVKELKEKYGFEGNVTIKLCESKYNSAKTSLASWIYVYVLVSIILANIVASILIKKQNDEERGLGYDLIQAFNISSNWSKLTSQKEKGKIWLQSVQGLRTVIMTIVILSHIPMILYNTYMENPEVIEMLHGSNLVRVLFSGTIIIQIFFCLSSFLMSYHFLKYAEKNQNVGFKTYSTFVLQRWLRLTPVYAAVIGFIALWSEKLTTGPLTILYNLEADACRKVWWHNLFQTNNIFSGMMCIPPTWYLAVDSQLYCIGLFIMIMVWKLPEFAKHILGGTLIIATVAPGVLTYLGEYPAILLITPETFREVFQKNDTFLNIYSQIQGNASSYALGMITGFIHFHLQRKKINLLQIKGITHLLYAIIPITLCVMTSGLVLYTDQVVLNPLTNAIFASLNKPIIGCLSAFFLICVANKLEVKLLENRILVIPGRLTYCALLVHIAVQKYIISLLYQPVQIGFLLLLWLSVASIAGTYFIAVLLFLFVEVPFCNIQKILDKLLTKTSNRTRNGKMLTNKDRTD